MPARITSEKTLVNTYTVNDQIGTAITARTVELGAGSEVGPNAINGTEDDDVIFGTPGDDLINGLGGNDTVAADLGDDEVHGGDGHDFLMGQQGNDFLIGGSGNDLFRGGTGDDVIDGGDGYDRVSFFPTPSDPESTGVTVSLLLQGAPQNTGHGMDMLVGIEALSGSPGNDSLTGDQAVNWLIAGGSGAGNDALFGMGGDDLLEVGSGDHSLDGGDGEDIVSFRGLGAIPGGVNANLFVQGGTQSTGQGSMTLTGIENLSGTPFADLLTGDNGDNLLAGDDGDDALVGASGNDRLYGDGAVMADLPAGVGTSGPPTLFADLGGGGNDSLDAGAGNDILVGGGGNDALQGGPGDDHLDGGSGTDTASFATGVGPVFVDLDAGIASGGDGNDTFVLIENALGSVFGDELFAHSGGSRLAGNGGDDLLVGRDGNDWLQGNSGIDNMLGYAGDDVVEGGDGNDLLFGDGNIHYDGPGGNDTLIGGAGNDLLRGGPGVDSHDGGDGFDRVTFGMRAATQGVIASLATQTVSNDGFGNAETMTSIEGLGGGTAFADHFTGDDNANLLLGEAGDTLIGNGGNDRFGLYGAPVLIDGGSGIDTVNWVSGEILMLVPDSDGDGLAEFVVATRGVHVALELGMIVDDGLGNSGTLISIENIGGGSLADVLVGDDAANVLTGFEGGDLLEGGLGDDSLIGGGGSDTASYASASGAVSVNLGSGTASGAGNDTLAGIENVTGSAFGDTLFGDGGDNMLTGGVGDDFLDGRAGADALIGGVGDDNLDGKDGDDVLDGGDGADVLIGGGGDDLMTGGKGQDRFEFGDGAGDDRITDFAKRDMVAIGAAGIDDFSNLTIASDSSGNAVISWGTGDSITLDGYKAKKLSAADFDFGEPTAARLASTDTGSFDDSSFRALIVADGWLL